MRWSLTGTPIQNSIDDLGSLIKFLKVPVLKEPAQFKRHIADKIDSSKGSRGSDFENLQMLLSSIALRRNTNVLSIDQAEDIIYYVDLSEGERQTYDNLGYRWRHDMELAVSGKNSREAHQIVVEALLRMRMFCNNGDLSSLVGDPPTLEPDELGSLEQLSGHSICHLCSIEISTFGNIDDSSNGSYTSCQRLLCGDCSEEYLKSMVAGQRCPTCGGYHAPQAPVITSDRFMQDTSVFPSKLEMLYQDLRCHMAESKRRARIGSQCLTILLTRCSVVFSCWKRSLDVVERMLQSRHIPCLRIDGSLAFGHRKRLLEEFKTAGQGMVLLMTLGTGAVG